jgi:hypothetical protein
VNVSMNACKMNFVIVIAAAAAAASVAVININVYNVITIKPLSGICFPFTSS